MCSETNPKTHVSRMAALSRQELDIDLMSQRDVTEKIDLFVRSLSPKSWTTDTNNSTANNRNEKLADLNGG
jgi:hypothetical protein